MDFILLLLATLVMSATALPWQASALVFAVGALVTGVRALRSAVRSGLRGIVLPVGVGLGVTAVMTLSLLTLVALWPLQAERQDCLRRALTVSAQEACEQQFSETLEERLDPSRLRPPG